jgi:hypothetical protein
MTLSASAIFCSKCATILAVADDGGLRFVVTAVQFDEQIFCCRCGVGMAFPANGVLRAHWPGDVLRTAKP